MSKMQIFVKQDPLYQFKLKYSSQFANCAFFESPVNRSIDIGAGNYGLQSVTEKIITNGHLSLKELNPYTPRIIWQNQLLTLENGNSLSIELTDATFMIDIITKAQESQINIHVEEEDEELLRDIIHFFYGKCNGLFKTESIAFVSPTLLLLESKKKKKESIQLSLFQNSFKQKKKTSQ